MSDIMKVTMAWTGFTGAPGYSNFYYKDTATTGALTNADATTAANEVALFMDAIVTLLPPTVKLQIQSDVPVINATTGKMSYVLSTGPWGTLTGSAVAGSYSAASGSVITWRTGGVRDGRRVRGRTFLVPLANSAYESDGTMATAALTTLQNAAAGMVSPAANKSLVVWARPTVTKNPDGTSTTGTDGNWYQVTSGTIPDRVAVLRSRRA